MSDPRVDALAQLLVHYCCEVEAGQTVTIGSSTVAEPLVMATYEEVLRAGGLPTVNLTMADQSAAYFKYANEEQLAWVPPAAKWASEEADATIRILADFNTKELSEVDPAKQGKRHRAMRPLMKRSMERSAGGSLKWALTIYPTHAYAADAEMSLRDYEDFYYRACLTDQPDPIAAWKRQSEEARRLAEWIEGREEVHITAPGTDIKLGISGRKFIVADGKRNMPDGEFFTGPIEDFTEGEITYTYPAVYGGREVAGVRLRFKEGRVVDLSADRNEEYLREMLETDPGASILGELGIGTNFGIDRFTKEGLLDEKIGGTIHLAVGAAYPETGGVNDSAVHWDMVCDLRRGGKIVVDGEEMQVDGQFVV